MWVSDRHLCVYRVIWDIIECKKVIHEYKKEKFVLCTLLRRKFTEGNNRLMEKKCRNIFKHLWEIRTIKYVVVRCRFPWERENIKNSQNISKQMFLKLFLFIENRN